MSKYVAHSLSLGGEIVDILNRNTRDMLDSAIDLNSIITESLYLHWIVCHQADFIHSCVSEHFGNNSVVTGVSRESQS